MNSTGTLAILFGIIVFAKLLGGFAQKAKIPSVLVELLIGIIIGNLGFHLNSPLVEGLSELGALLLMFLAGLETNLDSMKKSGKEAFSVAIVGVLAPMFFTFIALSAMGGFDFNRKLFFASTLTATSVGITVRVLLDSKKLTSDAGQIILGAAVIDDVLGILILAMMTSWVTLGEVSPLDTLWILGKAILFVATLVGMRIAFLSRVLGKIRPLEISGTVTVITLALCLFSSWAAEHLGLAGILGAFALGVALDDLHFAGYKQVEKLKLEDLIKPMSDIFVPVFFILMGMNVDLTSLLNPSSLQLSLILIACAILGKLACAFAIWRPSVDRWLVAFGMLPRGEVGIIFASLGFRLGIFSQADYSALVMMVFVTTFLAPSLIAYRGREKRVGSLRG